MKDVAKTSKNPTCSANFCFLSRRGGDGERPALSHGCRSVGLGDRMGWGSQAAGAGAASHLSPATASSSLSLPPSPQPLAPDPLPFSTFALFTNMSLEFKWVIYSVAASLSHRGPVLAWRRVWPKQREKKRKEQKNAFQLFLFLPPPSRLTLFSVCVCVGRALHWLSPPRSPPPCFHPLGPALAPFMLHGSSNGSPGGSYRECIGSLGERKPPTSYTPDV